MSARSDYIALKDALSGHENALLDGLRRIVAHHDARIGSRERLCESVATVLADAFRSAGVRNRGGLALSMAPVLIDGIRGEIRTPHSEIVDALYPIMGRLTSAYVLSVFRDFVEQTNRRLESGLSGRYFRPRLKSFFTGTPFAGLLLKEAAAFRIQDVMLIDAEKGVLLDRWRAPEAAEQDTPVEEDNPQLSAMLVAIDRFSTETPKARHRELRIIDVGASQLYLRSAAKCLFAVRATGSGGRGLLKSLDAAILEILEVYEPPMQPANREGASRARRPALPSLAEKLRRTLGQRRQVPVFAIALFALLGSTAAAWAGWTLWDNVKARRTYEAASCVVRTHSGLAGFPVGLSLDPGGTRLALTGLVPSHRTKEEL